MRRRRRPLDHGPGAWPAFVDLLAATSLLFVTLISVVVFVAGGELGRGGRIQTEREALLRHLKAGSSARDYEVIDSLPLFVRLTLNVDATFPSARWQLDYLRSPAREALRDIGERLRRADTEAGQPLYQEVRVRGHSDHRPVRLGSWTNWELSAARAASVSRFLADSAGLDPCKITAAGIGPYRPVIAPDSRGRLNSNSMRINRRIDIEIVPWSVRTLEGGGQATAENRDCYAAGDLPVEAQ